MKKILTSFAILSLVVFSFGAAEAQTARSGMVRAVPMGRAPTLPIPNVPSNPNPIPNIPTAPAAPVQPATPSYSADDCMADLSSCVENGLPNGIAALFNSDMRNSVINGMNLCAGVIDKCVDQTVRSDGNKSYYARNDVWQDFNSRVIQPQYYSLVLSTTGLTPNQAENTCRLLDKNTYGTSFTAVGSKGGVTSEYNRGVNPYNEQGTGKANPRGAVVNTTGAVDAERGHYARWDATTGECSVRVAAYNKGDLITNEWLFGIAGDKRTAEAWKKAGERFSCSKETFGGFNLRTDTETVAVVGMGGGTLVGGTVGFIVGKAKVKNLEINTANCANKDYVGLLKRVLESMKIKGASNMTAAKCAELIAVGEDGKFISDAMKGYTPEVVSAQMAEMNGGGKLKSTAIGAGVGLAAGGIATLITSFVEGKNIKCEIGDGLDSVAFGESGQVKSLKEYYVLWSLNLPDTVMPTQTVTECNSWNTACNSIRNINDCTMAAVLYKPVGQQYSTQVQSACTVSGNTCVVNNPVAVSYGACL